jgi:hypothetical protein
MKKLTLILACVGLFSTAIVAQTPKQDAPKKESKPVKFTKAKPVKKTAVLRVTDKPSPDVKAETKKK